MESSHKNIQNSQRYVRFSKFRKKCQKRKENCKFYMDSEKSNQWPDLKKFLNWFISSGKYESWWNCE